MGRGRVELKRIENKINRQVTFAKRRNGILKKAYELSIMCDAEVALIIFSNGGKLFEFSTNSSMQKTLEKYRKFSYGSLDPIQSVDDNQRDNYHEYLRLKARVEILQRAQRNLLGEDLDTLTTKELEQLEHQLEASLNHVRSTKTQGMLDQLAELRRREQMLAECNKALRGKLEECIVDFSFRHPWETLPSQSEGFFQPLGLNSTLEIGFSPGGTFCANDAVSLRNANGFVRGWMP